MFKLKKLKKAKRHGYCVSEEKSNLGLFLIWTATVSIFVFFLIKRKRLDNRFKSFLDDKKRLFSNGSELTSEKFKNLMSQVNTVKDKVSNQLNDTKDNIGTSKQRIKEYFKNKENSITIELPSDFKDVD